MNEDIILHSLSLVEEKLEQVIDCIDAISTKLTGLDSKLNDVLDMKNGDDRSSFAKKKVRQWLEITKK